MMMRMKYARRLLASLCIGTVLGGCMVTRAEMANAVKGYPLPADVSRGKGLIYIIDSSPGLFGIRKTVFLDGEDDAATIGTLVPGTYVFMSVQPGHHRIKLPEWSPYEVVVQIEEGDILFLQPVTDQKRNNMLIQVDGITGRYNVKRSRQSDTLPPADPQ